jgi:complement component 1 Q subcomponent-binding protein
LQTLYKPARSQYAAAFSTSRIRTQKEGIVDEELVQKFNSEIQLEQEIEVPTSVTDFLENSPWEIQDTPGQEEVVLKRAFGNETYVGGTSLMKLLLIPI